MLIKKITMVVLILDLLIGTSLLADVSFDCITVDEGLSQSSVSAIAQDSVGFMWFGTRDGLNRYDGNRINVYRQNDEQHGSLADNWITSLFADAAGTLWIGGLSGSVMHFEAAADSFCEHPLPVPFQSEVMVLPNERMENLQVLFPYFHEKSITAITGDGADGIWVATLSFGLFHISKKTGLAKVIPFPGNQPPIILRMVMLDYPSPNTLWIATYGSGLWQMNLDFTQPPKQHPVESHTEFLSLLPDDADSTALWAGTSTGAVLKMCLGKAVCQRIELKTPAGNSENGNPVLALLKSADAQLWIGTHGNGLYSYSERYGTVVWYPPQQQLKNALTISEVYTLCQDRAQNIWIGGRNGLGVHKIARTRKKFAHYSHRPGLPNSLSGNVIFGIAQDKKERLWIASAQSGLDCLDRKRNQITHYSQSADVTRRLSSDQLRCVSVTSKNDV